VNHCFKCSGWHGASSEPRDSNLFR